MTIIHDGDRAVRSTPILLPFFVATALFGGADSAACDRILSSFFYFLSLYSSTFSEHSRSPFFVPRLLD